MTSEHEMDCEDVERALRAGADLAPLHPHVIVCEACQVLIEDAGALAHRLSEIEISGGDDVDPVVDGVMARVARRQMWSMSTRARLGLLFGVVLTMLAMGAARAHDGVTPWAVAFLCLVAVWAARGELGFVVRRLHVARPLDLPEFSDTRISMITPFMAGLMVVAAVAERAEVDPELWAHATRHCATVGTAYGAAIVLLIWLTDRRSRMIARWWLAAIGAAGIVVTVYLTLLCPMNEWRHLLASHLLWVVPWALVALSRLLARLGLQA